MPLLRILIPQTKWSLRYFVTSEVIYVLYELAIATSPSINNMNALALGLLLGAITLPSNAVVFFLYAYIAQLLGYTDGEYNGFLSRFIGFQLPIILNTIAIGWFTRVPIARD